MRCIDISLPLTPGLAYPGDPPFARELLLTHGHDGCEVAALHTSAHAGTHLDLPAHYDPAGARLDDLPPDRFILPAVVLDAADAAGELGATHVAERLARAGEKLSPGCAVLLRTANSSIEPPELYDPAFLAARLVGLRPDGARLLADAGVALVGVDGPSVERHGSDAVHRVLAAAGILGLEGLRLGHVAAGRYTLVCLPLLIPGGEASPVRAVLLESGTLTD